MSFQVTVGLLAHNSTVSRGAPVWWACRWLVASDPESEVKWDLEGTSGRKWKRQQPLLPDISLGKGGFGHLLCTLGISWELWVSTVFATGQSANYRDQSREKGECQHMCLFEMQMTLRKGNNSCYGSCKIKKKKQQKNFRHAPPSPYSTSCMNFTHSTAGNEHHESPRTFRSNKPQASFLCCGMENILSILDEQHPLLSLKRKRCLCPLAFFYHSQIILSHKCSLFCLFYLNWTTWYQSLW